MKQASIDVLNYLKSVNGVKNVTAADVAAELGLEKRKVDGIFTSAICRKTLGERVEAEIDDGEGGHKKVKYFVLTQAGLDYDPASEEAEA